MTLTEVDPNYADPMWNGNGRPGMDSHSSVAGGRMVTDLGNIEYVTRDLKIATPLTILQRCRLLYFLSCPISLHFNFFHHLLPG
jgi:hypothetical protein